MVQIIEIGLFAADAEKSDYIGALLGEGIDHRHVLDQRREAGPATAGIEHGVISALHLILELPFYPAGCIGETAVGWNQSIREKCRQAVGAVLLISVPDFDVASQSAEILDGCVEQCGLTNALPS